VIGRVSGERSIREQAIVRLRRACRRHRREDEKKPATGLRLWLVFNCVLLQQSVKFD